MVMVIVVVATAVVAAVGWWCLGRLWGWLWRW